MDKLARLAQRIGVPLLPMKVEVAADKQSATISTVMPAVIEYGRKPKP